MDGQVAAFVNSLIAIVWTLSALIVAMAVGWLLVPDCDPACDHCKTKRDKTVRKAWFGTTEYCPVHRKPFHECRDMHRGD